MKKGVPDKGSFVKKSFTRALQASVDDDDAAITIKQKVVEQKASSLSTIS